VTARVGGQAGFARSLPPAAACVASRVAIPNGTPSLDVREQAMMVPRTTGNKQDQGSCDLEACLAKGNISAVTAFPAACQ
jgi:hypothetical protein